MATKALTYVAQRDSQAESARRAPGRGRGWRHLLERGDAEAIWTGIAALVRSHHSKRGSDAKAQEIFLLLLASNRFELFLDRDFTDHEIEQEILSLLAP